MKFKAISLGVSLLLLAPAAFSAPVVTPSAIIPGLPMGVPMDRVAVAESGDAGDSLLTAQAVANGTDSITGNGGTGDVDMYSFVWGGGALYIDSFHPTFTFDTQLFLFDSAGFGVVGNDDHGGLCPGTAASGLQSCLDLSAGLAAGTYYLAISAFNNDPLDAASTAMMSCSPFSSQCASTGGPLAGWTGASGGPGSSAYTINFSAATGPAPMGAPEPGILVLLGLGLAGLGFARRRS